MAYSLQQIYGPDGTVDTQERNIFVTPPFDIPFDNPVSSVADSYTMIRRRRCNLKPIDLELIDPSIQDMMT